MALVIFGFCAPSKSEAAYYADDLYYDQLDPYGDWFFVADYGWCWSPGFVSAGWRPYTVGYWVYSDWGWVWVSQDPWGSWPYHYGRWAFDASYGWVWVPGDTWGPAWVSWRYGSGWVGWAPLPPDVGWSTGIGISYSSYSLDRRIDSSSWCFVGVNDFASRRIRGRVAPIGRNYALMSETRNVTRYVDVGARPVERGLRVDLIERDSGKRIQKYDITERSVRGRGGVEVRGRTVQVSKPTRTMVRSANSKLRALPRERAERPRDRGNVNTSRQRREREADARMQEREQREQRERRAIQERSRRDREQQRSNQIQERRSRQREEQRSDQRYEQRSQAQERRSQQAQEQRTRQPRERTQQAEERRPRQERPSQQAHERPSRQSQEGRGRQAEQRKNQDQERRGRGGM